MGSVPLGRTITHRRSPSSMRTPSAVSAPGWVRAISDTSASA
jgi:hypothetical protein